MNIHLENIVPIPLRDAARLPQSQVWQAPVQFTAGEWVKVKAPSGTGKTTLVHIIWQLRSDYTGKVLYDDKNAADIAPVAMAGIRQQTMSVIFQDLRLFTNLTAFENIDLKRVMTPKPFYEQEAIYQMADSLGVTHVLQQQVATCSYGERQRIAIIRALMQPFEWLIMDEPFSHLDEENTRKAAALISSECKKRKAGFILTDLDEDSHFEYSRQLML